MSRTTAWILHLAITAMAATGFWLLWIVFLSSPPEETELEMFAVEHRWQPLLTTIHIVVAPVLVFAVGFIWTEHIWKRIGFKNAQRRNTGIVLVLVFVPLVLGGYCLQVVESETFRSALGWIHAGAGVLFAACYVSHLIGRPPRDGEEAGESG